MTGPEPPLLKQKENDHIHKNNTSSMNEQEIQEAEMIISRDVATNERWPANSMEMAKAFHDRRMEYGLGFEIGWKAAMEYVKILKQQPQ